MLRIFLKYDYFSDKYAANRALTATQVCFKPELDFLKLKKNMTKSLSNRLCSRSQFYQSYLNLQMYYISLMRGNFCKQKNTKYKNYEFLPLNINDFLLTYFQYYSMRNFDNVLL